MSLPSLITSDDFELRYDRILTAEERLRIEALIADASDLVRDAAAEDFVDDEGGLTEVPGTVVSIVVNIVRRAFDNPGGLESETVGSYTWRARVGGSGTYLTRDEERTLRRAVGKSALSAVDLEGLNSGGGDILL